jgi:addiction module HigA family antidote
MNMQKKAKRSYGYSPDYAVAPGETLKEVLGSLSITQQDLASQTGLTEQTIVSILKGIQPITFETAAKLEMVTGVPDRMWSNLEMQYREQLSKAR